MQSPFEAQALIQSDLIVSLGDTSRDGVLLLNQPPINYRPPNQRAPPRPNVGDGGKSRNLTRENVGQVRPRDAEVTGGRLDVHDLVANEGSVVRVHLNVLLKSSASSLSSAS
jgi:hypothetical protein